MPHASILPDSDSLADLQAYIWQINKERGFDTKDTAKKMLMLTEEVGELAKALRKTNGLKFTSTTQQTEAAEEIADVLIVLLGLASMLNINVFEAITAIERKNRERVWK